MEYPKEHILAQLEKIVADKHFSRSKVNVRLLTFLVHATLEQKDVKETTIGTAFFGKKYDPIKSDNKVRVYVYHLRKKLEEYYSNEAKENEIVFKIAKGQYLVQFVPFIKEKEVEIKPQRNLYVLPIAMAVLVLIAGLVWFLQKPELHPFWHTLMKNQKTTTLIFGDYFTIEGPIATRDIGAMRDYEINTEKELEVFLETHPEFQGKLRASRHHYFNWAAPYGSKLMTQFWSKHQYPFELSQVSEWSMSKLNKENVVYVGQTKAMGPLKNILTEYFPQFQYGSQKIFYTHPNTHKKTVYQDVIAYDKKMTDYTLVAKITLPSGNEMRFFLSDQDGGSIQALENFTDTEKLQSFYQTHQLSDKDDFIALFKVTGWQRKSYETTFVLLDKKEK